MLMGCGDAGAGEPGDAAVFAAIIEEGFRGRETDISVILDEVRASPNRPDSRRILALARPYRVFAFVMAPLTAVATAITSLAAGRARRTDAQPPVTVHDLLRILEDRKNGVRLTDFESALISRILVLRRKGQPVTPDALLRALDDED